MTTDQITKVKQEAINYFDIDEDKLNELIYENGVAYLEKRFVESPQIIKALESSAEFWLWWRETWATRDSKLLTMVERRPFGIAYHVKVNKDYSTTTLIADSDVWLFYSRFHSPDRIKFFPNHDLINQCLATTEK